MWFWGNVCSLADTEVFGHQLGNWYLPIGILHANVVGILSGLFTLDRRNTYMTIEILVRVSDLGVIAVI